MWTAKDLVALVKLADLLWMFLSAMVPLVWSWYLLSYKNDKLRTLTLRSALAVQTKGGTGVIVVRRRESQEQYAPPPDAEDHPQPPLES